MRGAPPAVLSVAILLAASWSASALGPDMGVPPALSAPLGPDEAPAEHPFAWTAAIPIAALEQEAPARVAALGEPGPPTPDSFPVYARLSDDEKRVAWRAYLLRAWLDAQGGAWAALDDGAVQQQGAGEGEVDEAVAALEAHGVKGLWNLELHGYPRDVVGTGDGAILLVTTLGVLRFPTPGQPPLWMSKPGYVRQYEAVDLNGDGTVDLVLGVSPYDWDDEEAPSIVVMDGLTGGVISSGFAGDDRLYYWALTDVDQDGTPDLLGRTRESIRAARLDGTVIHETTVEDGSVFYQGFLFFYIRMYDFLHDDGFADVDGDGVTDFVLVDQGYDRVALFIDFVEVQQIRTSAYSGRDGRELWAVEETTDAYVLQHTIRGVGDLDGDGKEDLVIRDYQYPIYTPGLVRIGYTGLSGADGGLLFDDRRTYPGGVPFVPGVRVRDGIMYDVLGIADMDGDGRAEIIAGTGEDRTLVVSGRVVGASGETTTEAWSQSFTIDGDVGDGDWRFRDADADGLPELLVTVVVIPEAEGDDDDDTEVSVPASEAKSTVFFVSPEKVDKMTPSTPLIMMDLDETTGQGHGWTLGDVFAPVGKDGAVGTGMKLIVSTFPLLVVDVSGDKVPDILVRKSVGVRWIDGASGRVLSDWGGMLGRDVFQAAVEVGRPVLLEWVWSSDEFVLSDLKSHNELWRVDAEIGDSRFNVRALADMDGDRLLDLVLSRLSYAQDADGRFERQLLIAIVYPSVDKPMWQHTVRDGSWIDVEDALARRPGWELFARTYRDGDYSLQMIVPDEGLRWKAPVTGGTRIVDARDGLVLLLQGGEGDSLAVHEASGGNVSQLIALEDDAVLTGGAITSIDGVPAVVASWGVRKGDRAVYTGLVRPLADEATEVRFALHGEAEADEDEYGDDYVPWWGLARVIDDWDGDGRPELVFSEDGMPVVRSAKDGAIIAIAPRGDVIESPDMNQDGRSELLLVGDSGRLRLVAYDRGAKLTEEEAAVRHITAPDLPVSEDKSFFVKDRGIPAPGAVLLLVAVGLALSVLRRRR